ncbi:MAG: hypothetical protein ABJC04_03175 [Verrucomicrobiota bacterium]
MNIESSKTLPVYTTVERYGRCLSWRAVFAGVVGALGLHLLLSLIATGWGLAAFDPLTDAQPAKNFGMGAVIGWSICALLSLFFGGWIAGRFNGGNKLTGGLHGFLVWSVAMIATFGLIALGGGMALGGLTKIVGAGVKGAGSAVGGLADVTREGVKQQGDQLKSFMDEAMSSRPSGSTTNTIIRAQREISFAATKLFAPGSDVSSAENRAALVKALSANGGMSDADAQKLVDEWTESYQQLKTELEDLKTAAEKKAREAADVAARKLSKAAQFSFFAFWIGAILASIGGVYGARTAHREITVVQGKI